jgi:hypothetical protein
MPAAAQSLAFINRIEASQFLGTEDANCRMNVVTQATLVAGERARQDYSIFSTLVSLPLHKELLSWEVWCDRSCPSQHLPFDCVSTVN